MTEEKFQNQLRLDQPILTKDIKILYLTTAGFSFSLWNVEKSIQYKILEAISHFKSNGVSCELADFGCDMTETLEIALSIFFDMEDIPDLLSNSKTSVSNKLIGFRGFSVNICWILNRGLIRLHFSMEIRCSTADVTKPVVWF